MAGPQRIAPDESSAADQPASGVGLPAFDLDIPPLRPVPQSSGQSVPSYGPLPRARQRAPEPDGSVERALEALVTLLAQPLETPTAVPEAVIASSVKTVEPELMALADERAGEPEVWFATTTVDHAAPIVAQPIAAPTIPGSIIRSTMAVQRAAFEVSEALPDWLPQLQPSPAAKAADTPDDLPFGSVTYRLFVM